MSRLAPKAVAANAAISLADALDSSPSGRGGVAGGGGAAAIGPALP
jgi:hypothetical protein